MLTHTLLPWLCLSMTVCLLASSHVRAAISAPNCQFESFEGNGILTNFAINNGSALPDIGKASGRYRANLEDNSDNITLHFNSSQGRLDAWLTRFPFEYTARNIGIGTQQDSQQTHPYTNNAFNFAGVQVHVADLNSANSSHIVVGHRGNSASYTVEGKNTVDGVSSVNDIGSNMVPDARADIRIVGSASGTLVVYWQLPNLNYSVDPDNWILYNGTGQLPGAAPVYGPAGSNVYIGLITYAYGSTGIPFVGTVDSVNLVEFSEDSSCAISSVDVPLLGGLGIVALGVLFGLAGRHAFLR